MKIRFPAFHSHSRAQRRSHSMSKILFIGLLLIALALAFLGYLQADFTLDMANRLIWC